MLRLNTCRTPTISILMKGSEPSDTQRIRIPGEIVDSLDSDTSCPVICKASTKAGVLKKKKIEEEICKEFEEI